MKRIIVLFSSILLIVGVLSSPSLVQVHAATGTVCLVNSDATACPSTPSALTSSLGSQLRLSVFIQGSNVINGFDITVLTDNNVLRPVGADLNGSILPGPQQVLLECINGSLVAGTVCSSTDTLGTLHLAVVACPGCLSTSTTGLLFTAIYNVAGSSSGSPIGFQTGCSNTSVSPNACVTIANGGVTPVPETVQTATFSTTTMPDFAMSASPVSQFVVPGDSGHSTITVTSINGFNGTVSLTLPPACLALFCPVWSISPSSLNIPPGGVMNSTLTFGTTTETGGTWGVTVTGTSGGRAHNVTATFILASGPDFSMTANPNNITINCCSAADSTITLASLSGFSGTVSLAAAVSPAGPAVSLNYPNVTLSAGGTGSSILSIYTSNSTSAGTYSITVTGTSGTLSHTVVVSLTVNRPAPDFSITADPTFISIPQGASAASQITVYYQFGFSGVVTLTFSHPVGITAVLTPTSFSGSGIAVLTVTGNATGTFPIQVTGTSGALSHSAIVTVTVTSAAGIVCIIPSGSTVCPLDPALLTGAVGTQIRVSVFIQGSTGLNGFDITLLADHTILRSAGIDLSGSVLIGPPTILLECVGGVAIQGTVCSSVDTIDTLRLAATSAVGSPLTNEPTTGLLFTAIYNITGTTSGTSLAFQTGCSPSSVSGTTTCVDVANGTPYPAPETVQAATFSNGPPQPDFTITPFPKSQTVTAGSTTTSQILLSSINGFNSTINLTVSPPPLCASCPSWSISPSSVGVPPGGNATSTLTFSSTPGSPPGTYTVTVTATSGTLSHSVSVAFTITTGVAPDFTITANPNSITTVAGSSVTSTITLTSTGGFTGSISLFSTSPTGLTSTLNPAVVSLPAGGSATSTLTVATSSSTAPGSYTVTITGTSGSISHTLSVTTTVTSLTGGISIDGSAIQGCGHNTNSCSTLFSTSHSNDVIIVYTMETLDLQTVCTFSVSDSAGLSWTLRANVSGRNDGTTGTDRDQLAEFWARSTGTLSSDNITESISGCASTEYGGEYNGLMVFGMSGANFNNPFDPNTGLPGKASSYGNSPSAGISTSNSNDLIIGVALQSSYPTLTPGPGFTLINTGGGFSVSEYEHVSSPVTSFPVAFGDNSTWYWEVIGDAVQASSSTTTGLSIDGSGQSFCGNNTSSCSTTLSTQHGNDIIIVYATEALDLQTSCTFVISDTAGLSWTARSGVVFDQTGRSQLQEFWARSTNTLTSDMVTESIAGCGNNYNGLMVFGITGANFNNPFDPNTSLPGSANGYSANTLVPVSTSNSNDMIIGAAIHGNVCCALTPGPGFTSIISNPGAVMAAEYENINGSATSFPVIFDDTVVDGWISIGDAIQSGSTTPDFSVSANPTSLIVTAGSSTTSTISLASLNGFSGTVALTATVSPSGPAISLSPASFTLTAGGTGSSILTISTSNSTAPGTYSITVTGTSAAMSHSTVLSLTVTSSQQGFSIAANPTSLTISLGSSGTSTITVTALNGFNGVVSLTVSHSPGIGAAVNPTSVNGSGTAILTIGANSTGTFTVQVTGTSGSVSHSVTVSVIVTNVGVVCIIPSGTTSCQVSPASITGAMGTQLRVSVFIQGSGGLNAFDVTLLADHTILAPAGVDLTGSVLIGTPTIILECLHGTLIQGNICSSTDTVDTLHLVATSALGSPLTLSPTTGLLFTAIYNVTGTTSGISLGFQTGCSQTSVAGGVCVTIANGSTLPVHETVQPATFSNTVSQPDFSISANPSILALGCTGSATSGVTLSSINGFNGTVSLTLNVAPVGISASISPASVTLTAGGSGASTLSVSLNGGPFGTYQVTVTGTSGGLTHSTVVFVNVTASPCFGMTAIPNDIFFLAGQTVTSTITVTSLGGFTGTIVLSATSPAGLTTSLNPTSVVSFGTSTLTISSTSSTPPGNYTLTVTGTSGTQTQFVIVNVTVLGVSQPDFNMSASPTSITTSAGSVASSTMTVAPINGFTGTITLASAVSSTGLTCTLNATSLVLGPSQTSTLLCNGQAGTYTVTVTGTSGALSHAVMVSFIVTDFTIASTPTTQTIARGTSATFTITIRGVNGFNGTVGLSTTVSPVVRNGPRISLISTVGPYSNSTLTVSTARSTPIGTYIVTVTATSGSITHKVTITVVVTR